MFKDKKIKITFTLFFRLCMLMAMLIHLLFFILFFVTKVTPLAIFNVGSVFLYTGLYIFLGKNKQNILFVTITTFIEVCIHMLLCVHYLGWSSGFFVYPLCMIPAVYFVSVNVLKKDYFAHIITFITFFAYALTKVYADSHIGAYEHTLKKINNSLYLFNNITACFLFSFLTYSFLCEMRDIQKDLEDKNDILENVANIDVLTGIYNRRRMNQKIENEIKLCSQNNKNFVIAICDIDDFKNINDTYGHDCGDIVLKGIANILKINSRDNDMEICRWGGEEFLMLIRQNINTAQQTCENILNDIREYTLDYNNKKVQVTMTIGLEEFNEKNNDIEIVLKNADINLYKGKKSTKDCVIYTQI